MPTDPLSDRVWMDEPGDPVRVLSDSGTYLEVSHGWCPEGTDIHEQIARLLATIEEREERIATLEKAVHDNDAVLNDSIERNIKACERVAELQDVVADWEQSAQRVAEDRCHEDERHCGCVVHLRKLIAELEPYRTLYFARNPNDPPLRPREETDQC